MGWRLVKMNDSTKFEQLKEFGTNYSENKMR